LANPLTKCILLVIG